MTSTVSGSHFELDILKTPELFFIKICIKLVGKPIFPLGDGSNNEYGNFEIAYCIFFLKAMAICIKIVFRAGPGL